LTTPYQSYVLNDVYKVTTYNVPGNWENQGTLMQGDWYFNDSNGSHRRTFYSDLENAGRINTTDLSECTTGGGTDPEQLDKYNDNKKIKLIFITYEFLRR
jgi:hypothetical protein